MNFYRLKRPPRRDDKIPLGVTDEHLGCIIVKCPECGVQGVMPGNRAGRQPVEILVMDVAYVDDIEQAFATLLASRKFRDAVVAAGLTGIEFYPPVGWKVNHDSPEFEEVLRQARDEFQFRAIHITGNGGSIAERSGMSVRKSCEKCGWKEWTLALNGYHIDESQWDGSDFFYVEEGPSFMSERAVQTLQAAKLSNFGAVRADEFRLPHLSRNTGHAKATKLSKQQKKQLSKSMRKEYR